MGNARNEGNLREEASEDRVLAATERTHEFTLSVPASALSLGVVRRAVQGLADVCGPDVTDRLSVIYSELVTNAIRHSGADENVTLEVELKVGPFGVKGKVVDCGPGFDPRKLPKRRPGQEGGFGLRIVHELASRWGVRHDGHTEVWFEL
jgi:anti-sigma regulatory factor (Ser/Thr protein kinase)